MRKALVAVLMEGVVGAIALFVEERYAIPGDIFWLCVALAGVLVIVALYSPEITRWVRKSVERPKVVVGGGTRRRPPSRSRRSPVGQAVEKRQMVKESRPTKAIWIDRQRALHILRHSSLVPGTKLYAGISERLMSTTGKTAEDRKIDDLTQGLYLEFENQHPEAVRADGCDERMLRLWISRQIREKLKS